jgi:Mg-chelatase subunit ChlD
MSGSTWGPKLDDIIAATDALLDGLRAGDRVALTTFNHVVSPRVALTADAEEVRPVLRTMMPHGDTSILDGIYASLMSVQAQAGRSLVVVCTDGRDTSSWLDADEVLATASRSNAVIDVVAAGSARRWPVLTSLTSLTGGETIDVSSTAQIRREFESILRAYRQRYVLSFIPSGVEDGGFHKLDVRVRDRHLTVKARPGYVGGTTARQEPR